MKVKMVFETEFIDEPTGNRFIDLPNDLNNFLKQYEGTMSGVVEHLYPGKYEITIGIKGK